MDPTGPAQSKKDDPCPKAEIQLDASQVTTLLNQPLVKHIT